MEHPQTNPICMPSSDFANLAFNIGVHVAILFLILSVFFMFYISKVSSNAINGEIIHNIDEYLKPQLQKYLSSPGTIPLINNVNLDKIQESLKENDPIAKEHNNWLFRVIVIINVAIILFLVWTTIVLRKSCNICLPVKDILIMNAVIFVFIGIVEFLFFKSVALKFVPVQPSVITKAFINNFRDTLK